LGVGAPGGEWWEGHKRGRGKEKEKIADLGSRDGVEKRIGVRND